MRHLTQRVDSIKTNNKATLEDRVPIGTISKIRSRVKKESILAPSIDAFEARVFSLEKDVAQILHNQEVQNNMI